MVTEAEKPVRSLCSKKHERKRERARAKEREKRGVKTEFIGLGGRLRGPFYIFNLIVIKNHMAVCLHSPVLRERLHACVWLARGGERRHDTTYLLQ